MSKNQQERKQDVNNFEEFHEFHEFYMSSFNEYEEQEHGVDHVEEFSLSDATPFTFSSSDQLNELDTKYRSISAVPPLNSLDFNLATQQGPPEMGKIVTETRFPASSKGLMTSATQLSGRDQPKATVTAPKIEVTTSQGGKSSRPIFVPSEPFYVAPSTHFLTKLDVGDMKARVEEELKNQPGLSFEFFPSKCRWEGVYLDGAARCKFEINVYKRSGGELVVEGNRLSGDSYAFINIYKSLLNLFVPCELKEVARLLPIPDSICDVDSEAIDESIDSVLSMANSGIGEAQVGASQIFCDIFQRTHATHLISKLTECIASLVHLVDVEFQSCNQHAVCALAQLSSTHSGQEVLMRDERFLHTLLPLCSDGSYSTMEMRRECARLLANISCSGQEHARHVLTSAGAQNIQAWMESVDSLRDERLRVHADRAKMCLTECIDAIS
jgi:hypothetical protein